MTWAIKNSYQNKNKTFHLDFNYKLLYSNAAMKFIHVYLILQCSTWTDIPIKTFFFFFMQSSFNKPTFDGSKLWERLLSCSELLMSDHVICSRARIQEQFFFF